MEPAERKENHASQAWQKEKKSSMSPHKNNEGDEKDNKEIHPSIHQIKLH